MDSKLLEVQGSEEKFLQAGEARSTEAEGIVLANLPVQQWSFVGGGQTATLDF